MSDELTKLIKRMTDVTDLWPVTIVKTRYQGSYEGGTWAAFNMHLWDVPRAAMGSDTECLEFWSGEASRRVGRGSSPNAAYGDLIGRQE